MCRLHALNSLLPPVVNAHSKVQGVLYLVPLPNIDESYAMINGSTVYFLLYCTSGCPIMLFGRNTKEICFCGALWKVLILEIPFGLAEVPTHSQQIMLYNHFI